MPKFKLLSDVIMECVAERICLTFDYNPRMNSIQTTMTDGKQVVDRIIALGELTRATAAESLLVSHLQRQFNDFMEK